MMGKYIFENKLKSNAKAMNGLTVGEKVHTMTFMRRTFFMENKNIIFQNGLSRKFGTC